MPIENKNSVSVKEKANKTNIIKNDIVNALSKTNPVTDKLVEQLSYLSANGQLTFPKGYDVGNQAKLMFVDIQQSGVLNRVSDTSVAQAFALALLQGLEYDKKQVYFIPYGDKLTCIRSYFGDTAVAKRTGLVKEIYARVIFEDDTFDIDLTDSGEECVRNHKTSLANHDKPIIGAYAWCIDAEGKEHYCVMSKKEIEASWAKSKTRASSSSVHNEFPQEMAKRTVIRRLVKLVFNTAPTNISDETKSIINAYNRSTSDEYVEDLRAVSDNKTTTGRRTNVIAPKISHEHDEDARANMSAGASTPETNPKPTSFDNDVVEDNLPSSLQDENVDDVDDDLPILIDTDEELGF